MKLPQINENPPFDGICYLVFKEIKLIFYALLRHVTIRVKKNTKFQILCYYHFIFILTNTLSKSRTNSCSRLYKYIVNICKLGLTQCVSPRCKQGIFV